MKVKALQSFVGRISMNIDDERNIVDIELAKDLIKAGYVEEIKATKIAEPVKEIIKEVEEKAEKGTDIKVGTKRNKNKK